MVKHLTENHVPIDRLQHIDSVISTLETSETEKFTINVENVYDAVNTKEYWLTTITPKDSNALKTVLKKDFAYTPDGSFDATAKETPLVHADRVKAIFATNASGWDADNPPYVGSQKIDGIQIKDGVVYQSVPVVHPTDWYTLGVDGNGLLQVFQNNTPTDSLLAQGIVNTWAFSIPIIQNGAEVSSSIYSLYGSYNLLTARTIIGQVTGTNEIIIMTVDYKTSRSVGMTLPECAAVLLGRNCRIAYCLDGGGSAQAIYNGVPLNHPSDGQPRATSDLLYVSLYENYDNYADVHKKLVDAIGSFPSLFDKLNSFQKTKLTLDDGTIEYTNNVALDYNQIRGNKFLRHYTDDAHVVNDSNAPWGVSVDAWIINIQSSSFSQFQLVFDRKSNQIAYRFNNLGTWFAWNYLNETVSFTTMTLLNSWLNVGGSDPVLQYCKKNGFVYVKGSIKAGTNMVAAANLPVGMRPATRVVKSTQYDNGSGATGGRYWIEPTGDIIPINTASNWFYIDTVFPAEQ